MVTYKEESFSSIRQELEPLWQRHWEEIACDRDLIKLEPCCDRYLEAERTGSWFCVTARDEGVLVGYFMGFVLPHLHYRSSVTLFYDIFYVRPESRRGRVGVNLFKFVEDAAKARGVQRIYVSTKLAHDVGALFDSLGYRPIERVYSKLI